MWHCDGHAVPATYSSRVLRSLRPLLAVIVILAVAPTSPAWAQARAAQRTAQKFNGVPTVGALFVPGAYPSLHTCTASVVRSASGDVIMTAAHCVTGTGTGYRFAPGYHDGKTPYGVWSVTAAYGDPAWIARQDPHRDWAFLVVSDRQVSGQARSLQSVTGANRLAGTAATGSRVTVIGYGVGGNDQGLRCATRGYRPGGPPAVRLRGDPAAG